MDTGSLVLIMGFLALLVMVLGPVVLIPLAAFLVVGLVAVWDEWRWRVQLKKWGLRR
jgi:hypothetical protein